jgi:hypothetical protein
MNGNHDAGATEPGFCAEEKHHQGNRRELVLVGLRAFGFLCCGDYTSKKVDKDNIGGIAGG